MGGRQYTEFLLRQERAKRARLQSEVAASQRTAAGFQAEIESVVSRLTIQVRRELSETIQQADDWRKGFEEQRELAMPDALQELEPLATTMKQSASEGNERLRQLLIGLRRESGAMTRDVAERLLEARTLLAGARDMCRPWSPETVADWNKAFESADRDYEDGRFSQAEQQIEELVASVHSEVARCQELAEKQSSRLQLLKAVRQVCCELGMRETRAPHYEADNDESGRILMTVASADRGEISFALTLDGISSEAAPGQCLRDIKSLERLLRTEHEIETAFRDIDDDPPQDKSRKRRRDTNRQAKGA